MTTEHGAEGVLVKASVSPADHERLKAFAAE